MECPLYDGFLDTLNRRSVLSLHRKNRNIKLEDTLRQSVAKVTAVSVPSAARKTGKKAPIKKMAPGVRERKAAKGKKKMG